MRIACIYVSMIISTPSPQPLPTPSCSEKKTWKNVEAVCVLKRTAKKKAHTIPSHGHDRVERGGANRWGKAFDTTLGQPYMAYRPRYSFDGFLVHVRAGFRVRNPGHPQALVHFKYPVALARAWGVGDGTVVERKG